MYRRKRNISVEQSEPVQAVTETVKRDPRQFPSMTLTVQGLMDELHISKPFALSLISEPDFPSFRLGRRILIDREGLQAWIARRSSQPIEPLDKPA